MYLSTFKSILWGNWVWQYPLSFTSLEHPQCITSQFYCTIINLFFPLQHPETLSPWKLYQLLVVGAVSSSGRPERWSEPIRRLVTELSPRFWQHGWWYCNWTWTFSTFIALSHPRHYTTPGQTSPDINKKKVLKVTIEHSLHCDVFCCRLLHHHCCLDERSDHISAVCHWFNLLVRFTWFQQQCSLLASSHRNISFLYSHLKVDHRAYTHSLTTAAQTTDWN